MIDEPDADPNLQASLKAREIIRACKQAFYFGDKFILWRQAIALHERCPTEATDEAVKYTCRHVMNGYIPRRAS